MGLETHRDRLPTQEDLVQAQRQEQLASSLVEHLSRRHRCRPPSKSKIAKEKISLLSGWGKRMLLPLGRRGNRTFRYDFCALKVLARISRPDPEFSIDFSIFSKMGGFALG